MSNLNIIRKLWDNYKYRFVPWLSIQLNENKISSVDNNNMAEVEIKKSNQSAKTSNSIRVHHIEKNEDCLISSEQLEIILGDLFKDFTQPNCVGKDEWGKIKGFNEEVMLRQFGFTLERKPSTLGPSVGSGVFIQGGTAKAGSVVGLYPGTIYLPSEPLLLASIRNQFIFRCKDGLLIDGNDRGISKSIFKSCASRDKFNVDVPCCDVSWLTTSVLNPLNLGQYVNNENEKNPHNVVYQECSLSIPGTFEKIPPLLWQFLPNIWYNPSHNEVGIRLIPLVAVRDIEEGEELFSSYFTVVHN